MKLRIAKDYFDNPRPPRLFLCTTGKKIINELPAYDTSLSASWNKYAELKFTIDRQYTDVITGETIINPLFDKTEGLRKVYVENIGYFTIQDPNTTYSDKDIKALTAFSSEYETGSKYLENFHINTGEVDSAEVMYLEKFYGEDYGIEEDDRYKPDSSGKFDAYQSYFVRKYTDADTSSYAYEQIPIATETDYKNSDETLYVKKYPNIQFYSDNNRELSLLHLVFQKIPEWKIGYVDRSLWRKERKFDENRIAVYDFLMNKVADTFKCVVEWDTLTYTVNFYEEAEDGITDDNTIQTDFDTDIYITRENLANEINVTYSSDNIKTKLKVMGSDDLNIRDVNLGKTHIINLDFYRKYGWLEQDVAEAYDNYLNTVEEYSPLYSEAVSARAGAYNRWNDLVNAVPAEGNIVLIGDPFEKLYCYYTPIDTAYTNESFSVNNFVDNLYLDKEYTTQIDKEPLKNNEAFIVQGYHFSYKEDVGKFECTRNITLGTAKDELIAKLNSYHVNEDINGNKTDNILLKLRDKDKNTITMRIYAPPVLVETNDDYDASKKYYRSNDSNGRTFYSETRVNNGEVKGLYTISEDYQIRYELFNDSSGLDNNSRFSSLDNWISGNITAENLVGVLGLDNIDQYTISHIGTMGAYFVLAKDETKIANLQDYGVNLLKEKHDTYSLIFQTQTENMYSQEKYQCVSSNHPPEEPIPDNTRWLNTSVSPSTLYIYDAKEYHVAKSYIEGMRYYTDYTSGAVASPQPTKETFKDRNYYIQWRPADSEEVSATDKQNHENYQRYLDNYRKLQAVQQVLIEKETEAEYCLNGYAVSNILINIDNYKENDDGELVDSNGNKLVNIFLQAAIEHFSPYIYNLATNYKENVDYYINNNGNMEIANPQPNSNNFNQKAYYLQYNHQITESGIDNTLSLYTFKSNKYPNEYSVATSYDPNTIYYILNSQGKEEKANPQPNESNFAENTYYILVKDCTFAVYLKNKTPYIAFASSVGVNQVKMDYYSKLTDFESFFNEEQWISLSPLIREDEFSDNNFLLTGYESEEERMAICKELMETAAKELKTLSQPSLEFSMTMGNILALPEFNTLTSKFELGKFIRVELTPNVVKRSRLLGVDLDFDNLSSFSCEFGDLVTTRDQIDLHAELMQQAVQAGKQVAASASNWQRAVEKSNKLEQDIANGLQNAALEVGRASGQSIVWDEYGIWGRKLVDGTKDQYEPEQFRIINNKLVFSNDGFKTSKAVFGSYTIDGETRWGPLAEYVTADIIEGKLIKGGTIEIGGRKGDKGKFIVHEDGSVDILGANNEPIYATEDFVSQMRQYHVELSYSGSTIFTRPDSNPCVLTCHVYSWEDEITSNLPSDTEFKWFRDGELYKTTNVPTLSITRSDIDGDAQISCTVTFDETQIK